MSVILKRSYHRISVCLLTLSMAVLMAGTSGWTDEDYSCEVMAIQGSARVSGDAGARALKQGDLLRSGDIIESAADSHVDVAFDKEWNNVARVGPNTRVAIKSVFPTGLRLDNGDIFSRLMSLPKGSTFEIQTPSAVAAVRGTVYWTEYQDGKTTVYNYSPSPVEVFNLDADSNIQERVVVMEHQKTEVAQLNEPPTPPVRMSDTELQKAGSFDKGIEGAVKDVFEEGRQGRAASVTDMEQKAKEHLETLLKDQTQYAPNTDDKRPASGRGGPGSGDSSGSGTGQNTTTGSNLMTTPTGSMPPPPSGFTAPEPLAPPPMPPMDSTLNTIQNQIDTTVNTVNQTVNTQQMLTTTTSGGVPTGGTTTTVCPNGTINGGSTTGC
jgi:hypothetical protein